MRLEKMGGIGKVNSSKKPLGCDEKTHLESHPSKTCLKESDDKSEMDDNFKNAKVPNHDVLNFINMALSYVNSNNSDNDFKAKSVIVRESDGRHLSIEKILARTENKIPLDCFKKAYSKRYFSSSSIKEDINNFDATQTINSIASEYENTIMGKLEDEFPTDVFSVCNRDEKHKLPEHVSKKLHYNSTVPNPMIARDCYTRYWKGNSKDLVDIHPMVGISFEKINDGDNQSKNYQMNINVKDPIVLRYAGDEIRQLNKKYDCKLSSIKVLCDYVVDDLFVYSENNGIDD